MSRVFRSIFVLDFSLITIGKDGVSVQALLTPDLEIADE